MVPAAISNGSFRLARAWAASARCSSLNASRFASVAARRSPFEALAVMQLLFRRTSPAKTDEAKVAGLLVETVRIQIAKPVVRRRNQQNKSAKPQRPLKRSIPEFPTKVGGHHMTGSTDPARDSSLKDR